MRADENKENDHACSVLVAFDPRPRRLCADARRREYKVEAWHPELGTMTKDVEVTGGKPVDPGFSYTGTEKKPE